MSLARALAAAQARRRDHIVSFVETFSAAQGQFPTLEEIATGVGVRSVATVCRHLRILERDGIIQREHFRRRAAIIIRRR